MSRTGAASPPMSVPRCAAESPLLATRTTWRAALVGRAPTINDTLLFQTNPAWLSCLASTRTAEAERRASAVPNRATLTGIIFVLRSGVPLGMLPTEMGCGSGVTGVSPHGHATALNSRSAPLPGLGRRWLSTGPGGGSDGYAAAVKAREGEAVEGLAVGGALVTQ
jgi:hypothetical protein